MKKLITLVLALALVFAIAAPAMAAWGAPAEPTKTPFSTAVTLLSRGTDYLGNGSWAAYPANTGVVAGTTVYFKVSFTVPKAAEVTAYYGDVSGATLSAIATIKNLKDVKIWDNPNGDPDGIIAASTDVTDSKITFNKAKLLYTDAKSTYSAIFQGTVKAAGDATITAAYGYETDDELPLTRVIGGVSYKITASGIEYTDPTVAPAKLAIVKNNKDLMTGMVLTYNNVDYTVQPGPVFQYIKTVTTTDDPPVTTSSIATLTSADGDLYTKVLAAYTALTGVLGFKAGDTGIYYSVKNITDTFGYTKVSSAVGTYKGYTSSLTVTDGTNVPNTGDNMSVIGFVMVGLALLATAAVVVKKVRA